MPFSNIIFIYINREKNTCYHGFLSGYLKTLYPSANEQKILEMDSCIGNLYQKTGFQDGHVPSNTLNGTEVIDGFSKRINDDETIRGVEVTKYYHQAARHLINQALVENEQTSNATLVTIVSSTGNYPTPVNDLLEKIAVGLVVDQGKKITTTLKTILHRQAIENEVKKAKIPLGYDSIETMNGLTNTLFLTKAETYKKKSYKDSRKKKPTSTKERKYSYKLCFKFN